MSQKLGPDPAVLMSMIPPLTVQVLRFRGNQREPIPMPVRDGFNASGPGWSLEEVQRIDHEILEVAGGGSYEVSVVDCSEPTRKQQKWVSVFPADVHGPSKVPTTLQGVVPPSFPPQAPPLGYGYGYGAPPRSSPAPGAFGGGYGMPSNYGYGMPPQQPPQYPGYFGQPGYGHQPPPNPYGWPPPPMQPSPAPAAGAEVEALKNELNNLRLVAIQTEATRKMEEMQATHRRELEAIRATPKTDERAERERERADRAERDATEARRQGEATAAEARHRAELEALKASIPKNDGLEQLRAEQAAAEERRRSEAALTEERRRADIAKADSDRRFDALQAELARLRETPRGPDPFQMMLEMRRIESDAGKENARVAAEAQREAARLQAEAARVASDAAARTAAEMRAHMVNPVEMARLLQDSARSGDEVTRTMIGQFSDIMNLQHQAVQNLMQFAPQGESIPNRVVNIAEKFADRFSSGDIQVKVAQANAARAQAEAAKQQMAGWQAPPPVAATGAATGAPGAVPSQAAPTAVDGGLNGAVTSAAPAAVPGSTVPPAASPLRKGGKTDQEWFGQALGDVMNLRAGAAVFLDAVSSKPVKLDEHGQPLGLAPDSAAQGLLVASNEITKRGLTGIPAFEYLFAQQMYADLAEVLLPDVDVHFGSNGAMYRQEMLKYLGRLLEGLPMHLPEEIAAAEAAQAAAVGEADDEEDDGDETEEDPEPAGPAAASPVPAVAPRVPGVVRRQQQALAGAGRRNGR